MKKNYFTFIAPIKTIQRFCFLLGTFFSISISSYGQKGIFSSSGTLEVPTGVTTLSVQTWGASGGSRGVFSQGDVPVIAIPI